MNVFLEQAQKIEKKIIEDRRYLHENPELGFYLPNTQKYVMDRLDEIGINYEKCGILSDDIKEKYAKAGFGEVEGCTGIVAIIGSGSPCILLRADMDALPIFEETDVLFKSKIDGRMHACGHDSHTAMLLGAAQILKDNEKELMGTVKLMFQPGEEWGYGSKLMIDDGLLENPRVDAAFGIHIMPDQNAGTLNVVKGTLSQAMDTYMLEFEGYGGHSSQPHKTIDANMIMNQVYTSLNLLMTRESNPQVSSTFSVGAMGGGNVTNVIPERSFLQGNMRNLDAANREHLIERIPQIIDHTVKMWRGKYSILEFHTPTTYNNPCFIDSIMPSLEDVVGKENIIDLGPLSGSEDFSHISQAVPSAFVVLGTGKEGEPPVHNPKMYQKEEFFKYGSALHANVAMNWLKSKHE